MLKYFFATLVVFLSNMTSAQTPVAPPPESFAGMTMILVKDCTVTTGVPFRHVMYVRPGRPHNKNQIEIINIISADNQRFFHSHSVDEKEIVYIKMDNAWHRYESMTQELEKNLEGIFAQMFKAPTQKDRMYLTCKKTNGK